MSADPNLNTIDSAADIIDARRDNCDECGAAGVRVDSSNGYIVLGRTFVPNRYTWLMRDHRDDVRCLDCIEKDAPPYFDIGGDAR